MALEQTGLEFVAENAKAFTDAIGDAATALTGFDSIGGAAQKTFDVFGEIVTGALRRVGEVAVDAMFQAAGAVKDFLQDSVDEALDAEKNLSRLSAIITSTGGAAGVTADYAQELAMRFRDLAGGSDDAILAIEEIGLRAGTVSADVMPEFIQRTLDLAQVMGSAEAAATLLARAEEDPVMAMNKASRAGIIFSATLKEQIKQLVKDGKVAEATALVIGRLGEATSGLAESASKTTAGQWEILVGHFKEAQETVGVALLPLLMMLMSDVLQPGIAIVEDFATGLANIIKLLISGDFEGGIFGLQEDDPFIDFLFNVRDAIISTAGWIRDVGIPSFLAFGAWFLEVGAPAIGGFISGAWTWLVDAYKSVSDWINTVGIPAFNTLSDWFANTALPAIQPVIDAVLALWKAFTENDPEAFTTALSGLADAFKGLWDSYIQPALADMWADLVAWVRDEGWPILREALINTARWYEAFIEWGNEVSPIFLESLGEMIGHGTAWLLIEGIPSLVEGMIAALLIIIGLKKADIGESGKSFASGLVDGFTEYEGWPRIGETIDQLKFIIVYGLQRASDAAVEIIQGIGLVIAATWQEAVNSLAGFAFDLTAPLQESAINAINFISGLGNQFRWAMAEVGRLVGVGLVEGFQNNLAWVWGVITQGVAGLVQAIRDMLGIGSPSKVMADLIGLPMSQGIAQGLMSGQGAVMQAVQATVAPAMSPMQYAGIGGSVSNSNSQNWNLNVNSNQSSQGIISDFSIMQAMA